MTTVFALAKAIPVAYFANARFCSFADLNARPPGGGLRRWVDGDLRDAIGIGAAATAPEANSSVAPDHKKFCAQL